MIGGHQVKEGERAILCWASANRDEAEFGHLTNLTRPHLQPRPALGPHHVHPAPALAADGTYDWTGFCGWYEPGS